MNGTRAGAAKGAIHFVNTLSGTTNKSQALTPPGHDCVSTVYDSGYRFEQAPLA